MDREEITQKLNEWAKSEFGSEFEVDIDGSELTLFADAISVSWFINFKKNNFQFASTKDCNLNDRLIKKDIIKKFYGKAAELLNEYEQKKYTVQVIAQSDEGYLNFRKETKKYFISDIYELGSIKTQFTTDEINTAKKNINLAVDWDKAIIKQVNE